MRTYLWLVVAGSVGIWASLGCGSDDNDTTGTPQNIGGSGGSAAGHAGEAGNGEAGNGEAGKAGSGQAGNGQAGEAGSGQAGNGEAGNAGSGQAGNGGNAGVGGAGGSAGQGQGGSAGSAQGSCDMFNDFAGACDACLESSCWSQCTACEANDSCRDLLACAYNCIGDETCVNECREAFPDGVADFDPYFGENGCLQQNCVQCMGCWLGTSDEACDQCFQDKCLVECAEAMIDPDLMPLLTCLQECTDNACSQACVNQYPQAYSKLQALDACMQLECPTECAAGSSGCGLTTSDAACDDCFHVACGTECAAATADPDINALLVCMNGCGANQTCLQVCANQYPETFDKLAALDTCMRNNCSAQCGMKADGPGRKFAPSK